MRDCLEIFRELHWSIIDSGSLIRLTIADEPMQTLSLFLNQLLFVCWHAPIFIISFLHWTPWSSQRLIELPLWCRSPPQGNGFDRSIKQDWHNSCLNPHPDFWRPPLLFAGSVTVSRIESWRNYKGCGALMSQSSVLVEVAACVRNDTHNSAPVQAPLNISYCYANGLPLPDQRVGAIFQRRSFFIYLPHVALKLSSNGRNI